MSTMNLIERLRSMGLFNKRCKENVFTTELGAFKKEVLEQ